MTDARGWLERIHNLPLPGTVRIMNVCGGHERSITMAGLRGALPHQVELIPGPGCPVCVCPEEDIYAAIQLARRDGVIVAAFGDMLRVPCNAPKAEPRSLEQAKAAGGDVRPVSSPEEVLSIAAANTGKEVVFFAAGFETTTAPVAGLIAPGDDDGRRELARPEFHDVIEPGSDRRFGRQLCAEVKTAAPRDPLHEQNTLAEELPANSGCLVGGIIIDHHHVDALCDENGKDTPDVTGFVTHGQEGGASY